MARKYSEKTSEKVARTMREFKEGKLRSSSGKKVTSRKQAIAIGLSQARAEGYKVPSAPTHSTMLRGVPLVRVKSVKLPTGATAEIHIHHGKGGYGGVLVYPNGNELPLSLGVPAPKNPAEALRGAKSFLATVWGKTSRGSSAHSTIATGSEPRIPSFSEQIDLAKKVQADLGPIVEVGERRFRVTRNANEIRFFEQYARWGGPGDSAHVEILREDLATSPVLPTQHQDRKLAARFVEIVRGALQRVT